MDFACPKCGKSFALETPELFCHCPSCHSTLYLDLDRMREVLSFAPLVQSGGVPRCLQRAFVQSGVRGGCTVRQMLPCLVPFWSVKGSSILHSASSILPGEKIPLPGENAIAFEIQKGGSPPSICEVECEPDAGEKVALVYIPCFQATVFFGGKEYRFLVNRVSGVVSGQSLPRPRGWRRKLDFAVFLLMFTAFIATNLAAKKIHHYLIFNVLLFVFFYFFSLAFLQRKGLFR